PVVRDQVNLTSQNILNRSFERDERERGCSRRRLYQQINVGVQARLISCYRPEGLQLRVSVVFSQHLEDGRSSLKHSLRMHLIQSRREFELLTYGGLGKTKCFGNLTLAQTRNGHRPQRKHATQPGDFAGTSRLVILGR